MKNSDRLSINIPFDGFYESLYSAEIDRFIEQDADHYATEEESSLAPELRVTAPEFNNLLSDALNYTDACAAIAKTYMDCFDSVWSDALGIKLGLGWEEMTSPRFYNFETDRIFCDLSWGSIKRLAVICKRDGYATLAETIRKRFTSRDGFSSFYSNDLDSWLAKPLADWDHNELGTLLIAAHKASADYDSDWRWTVYYRVSDDGCYHEISNAIDWPKYESELAELRADKEAELRELDPDYVPPAVRCPDTLDLFKAEYHAGRGL